METSEKREKTEIEKAAVDLFDFAVDRNEIKALMATLPEEADIKRGKVEYELPILKIISVGWAITYYLENSPAKEPLAELFWRAVYTFSQDISSL